MGALSKVTFIKAEYLLTLVLLIFSISVLYLQSLKAPWVDECYSYYGVWHDSFKEFYYSMLTGINFSPPLYFLLNFILQLISPTSIELLRIQSLIWTLIGISLSFLLARKIFGSLPAFLATTLVVTQSHLLQSQSQEARHYTMFFAIAAWVLYMQASESNQRSSKKNIYLLFISHMCLCQIHYLGIVFSGFAGFSHFIYNKKKCISQRIPKPILISWLVSVPIYLFLLNKQSSHLGNWSKPNGLINFFESYNNSLILLSIIVPIALLLFLKTSGKKDLIKSYYKSELNILTATTSFFWLITPALFWVLSHATPLNLFVDRYFIPKEVAVIYLISLFFNLFESEFKLIKKIFLLKIVATVFCFALNFVNTTRISYGLKQENNYHHSLIIKKSFPQSKQPITIKGDPNYFPNAYYQKNEYLFLLDSNHLKTLYKKFSKKINIAD